MLPCIRSGECAAVGVSVTLSSNRALVGVFSRPDGRGCLTGLPSLAPLGLGPLGLGPRVLPRELGPLDLGSGARPRLLSLLGSGA